MVLNSKTGKMVYFGDIRYEDYTTHKDEERRGAYLARAAKIKSSWIFHKFSANILVLHLLW
jgi:hypothetical protein